MTVRLRTAGTADLPFVLSLAPRLAEFGLPPWRAPGDVVEAERRALSRALEAGSPDAPVLLAEDADGSALGFAYLETQTDYFTGRPHAHIAVLAVAERAQGRGVGRALLRAAEEWARRRGDPFISLNVFAQNTRARTVYEHLGYGPETLRYVKALERDAAP
ncbi:MAG TPA: GNAT family N-acetyltransferase [Gemmatimonadales bacterium]|nr:GNAT family N-acetyltransferase [Gemmatimonadales bacterium]